MSDALEYITPGLRPLAVAIASLWPDPANARKHDARNIAAITASLKRFGQQKPIVLDQDGQTIIAGSGTYAAALELGWKFIAASVSVLPRAEASAFAIADNRSAELAEWDFDSLNDLLSFLGSNNTPTEDLGWTPEELASLVAGDWQPDQVGEMPDRPAAPAPAQAPPPAGQPSTDPATSATNPATAPAGASPSGSPPAATQPGGTAPPQAYFVDVNRQEDETLAIAWKILGGPEAEALLRITEDWLLIYG